MRNLLEYPITAEEVEQELTRLRNQSQAEGGIGDIRPLVLTYLLEYTYVHREEFKRFLETKQPSKSPV